jgi:hypothetical protein
MKKDQWRDSSISDIETRKLAYQDTKIKEYHPLSLTINPKVVTVVVNSLSNYASSQKQYDKYLSSFDLSLGSISIPHLDAASNLFPIEESHFAAHDTL